MPKFNFNRPKKPVSKIPPSINPLSSVATVNKPDPVPGPSSAIQNCPEICYDLDRKNLQELQPSEPKYERRASVSIRKPKYELKITDSTSSVWLKPSASSTSTQCGTSNAFIGDFDHIRHRFSSDISIVPLLPTAQLWNDLFKDLQIEKIELDSFPSKANEEELARRQAIGQKCSAIWKELRSAIATIPLKNITLDQENCKSKAKVEEKVIYETFRSFDEEHSIPRPNIQRAGCVEWFRYKIPSRILSLTVLVFTFSLIGLLQIGFTVYLFMEFQHSE